MKHGLRRTAVGVTATAAVLTGLVAPAMAGPAKADHSRTVAATSGTSAGDVNPQAVGNGFFNADGVNIRTGPGTGYTSIGAGYKGQRITVHCTGTWWHITSHANGLTGWVYWPGEPESYVLLDYGTVDPPEC